MPRPVALHLALDLAHAPTLAGVVRREPLPERVLDVIKIAAGCSETTAEAAKLTREAPEALRAAAVVYLQTALFAPYADNYRVLGVTRTASLEEIRRHLRWLMMWLHPDRQRDDWQLPLAERVLSAWEELKTPERRRRYDHMHPPPPAVAAGRSRRLWRRPWLPWVQWPAPARRTAPSWALRVVVILAFGAVALMVASAGGWLGRSVPAMEGPGAPTTGDAAGWSTPPG